MWLSFGDDELETRIGDSWGHGTHGLRSYRPSTTCGPICSIKGLMPMSVCVLRIGSNRFSEGGIYRSSGSLTKLHHENMKWWGLLLPAGYRPQMLSVEPLAMQG